VVQVFDETEKDLRALIEADLGSIAEGADFNRTLIDWLHYRARLIPRRPRMVVISSQVRVLLSKYPAITTIRNELAKGGDLIPWLSDRIRIRKSDPKADLMFNDWQISHFHLGGVFVRPNKISRTPNGYLLFAHIASDKATLLDVQPHGAWAMGNLLRILLKVSPTDMRELKGVVGTENRWTDDEILTLRQNGLSTFHEIDGRYFVAPGLGISSSRHATRLVHACGRLRKEIGRVRLELGTNTLPAPLVRLIAKSIEQPVKLGIKLEAGQFIIYDKIRNLNFVTMPPLS
jgi:hypothetical protein